MLSFVNLLRFSYRVHRPRVKTDNIKALQEYRKQLHEARIRSYKQAVKYLNRIEDQFLAKHKQKTEEDHFNNQCFFRTKIARNSYLLYQNLQKNRYKHEQKLDRIQRYFRQQEIKKLNRERIRKILQYESAHYWLVGDNINEKFLVDKILPEYIGTTQYYHKLHSEALAYDELQFDVLQNLTKSEEAIKYKNKFLIPIYKELISIIKRIKFSDVEKIEKKYSDAKIRANQQLKNNEVKLKQTLESIEKQLKNQLEEHEDRQNTPQKKVNYIKAKLRQFISLLKKWKEYTDILSMTTPEVMNIIAQSKVEESISAKKKSLENDIERKREKSFVDAKQEDTEDEQLNLASFLSKQYPKTVQKQEANANSNQSDFQSLTSELAQLLKQQEDLFKEISEQIKEKDEKIKKNSASNASLTKGLFDNVSQEDRLEIDEAYLKAGQTTTSIEVLKEKFKGDEEFQKLLNIAGELIIQYPKLFKKIWETQIL